MAAPTSPVPSSLVAGRGFEPARALHARRAGPQHAGEAGPDLRDLDQEDGYAHPRRDGPRVGLYLYKILSILFYCNKGGCGGNILRNIVGNKGGLGGGYCVLHNNVQECPVSVSRPDFVSDTSTHPKSNPENKQKNTSKLLKNTTKLGRGGAITGNIVQYIVQ